MRINNIKGFTLVEVMVTVMLSVVVFAGIYTTYILGSKTSLYYTENIRLRQNVRGALIAMVNELREARGVVVIKEPGGVTINFYRPSIGTVSYCWSRSGGNANKIIRKNNSKRRVLARNISALSFDYLTTDSINIDIHASKTPIIGQEIRYNLKQEVALRPENGLFKK